MAVTVTKRQAERYTGGESTSWEFEFNIEGTDDCIEARIQLLYQTTGVYDGLVRQTLHVEYVGTNFYIGTVIYGARAPTPGRLEYQFEIGGETAKRYQSIATRKYPSTAVDYGGAIGVTKSGDTIEVQGQDVYVPSKAFSLKWTLDAIDFTTTLEQNLYAMTIAPVNSTPFMGYAAGEVLFIDASGGLKENDETGDLILRFKASPNLSNLTVGSISGIVKGGWELVDIVRETVDAEGSGVKYLKPEITGVYVHQVYNSCSFTALLGI